MAQFKSTKEKRNQMDEKSANPGDRMKHPLNLELLSRAKLWPSICYSETHSGAGIYQENLQKPSKPYISQLKEQVLEISRSFKVIDSTQASEPTAIRLAGKPFLDVLTDWWSQPGKEAEYPGSARQVAEFLRITTPQNFEIRLTENHNETFNRLRNAMACEKSAILRQQSFSGEISWLLEKDNLLLVVDPFRIFDSFVGLNAKKVGIHCGDIDLAIVDAFLQGIEAKANAIIHFWWPLVFQGLDKAKKTSVSRANREASAKFRRWCESAPDNRFYQAFHDGHSHKSSLIGIGGGASLVREVSRLDWKGSWLSPYITPLRE